MTSDTVNANTGTINAITTDNQIRLALNATGIISFGYGKWQQTKAVGAIQELPASNNTSQPNGASKQPRPILECKQFRNGLRAS